MREPPRSLCCHARSFFEAKLDLSIASDNANILQCLCMWARKGHHQSAGAPKYRRQLGQWRHNDMVDGRRERRNLLCLYHSDFRELKIYTNASPNKVCWRAVAPLRWHRFELEKVATRQLGGPRILDALEGRRGLYIDKKYWYATGVRRPFNVQEFGRGRFGNGQDGRSCS